MENYIKTKLIISNACEHSGLSETELMGVLNECLSELRQGMLTKAIVENMQLKERLDKKEADDSGT